MTTLTRMALHDLVWTKRIEDVAEDLGTPAGTITAICRKNHIPIPPPRYWRMVANGSPAKRRALPTSGFRRDQLVQVGSRMKPVFNKKPAVDF
ncbi:hypothetical protein NKJ36_33265 [Mesorhizobium sp. M0142]|uniref:hypothetical protein n=1 Tax=Mesorhizobium sp. M0142 TaxID=2956894 RepID=UPI00333B91A1